MSCFGFSFQISAVSLICFQYNEMLRSVFGLEKEGVFLRMIIDNAVSHQNACSVDQIFFVKSAKHHKYCYLTAQESRL